MDKSKKFLGNKYDRVMSRIYNRSRSSLISTSFVTRHQTQSSSGLGGKPSVSNISSARYSELPIVLNDYKMDEKPARRPLVVKPRRTLKSLDPALSPPRSVRRSQELRSRPRDVRARASAPSVLAQRDDTWPDSHMRQCLSSRSHTKLKELKDEIKAYQQTERMIHLRSQLYKSCGVVLDDTGQIAEDKAVQVEMAKDEIQRVERSEQRSQREDAGTSVPDEQMRPSEPRYPVDRYLVESSKKFEMVSIIDDDIWNPEPALKPEDEIILRKLHEMLQSTADDLKLLSGELSKYHEPGVQVKTAPTPLDDEFNEKVHIEEVVNAKFHGYKIVEKPLHAPEVKLRNDTIDGVIKNRTAKVINTSVGAKTALTSKRPVIHRNLGISRTRIIQIDSESQCGMNERLNNGKVLNSAPAVAYNEFSFKYTKPEITRTPRKLLQVQEMPSINIRSELKEQKVLQLDIVPDCQEAKDINTVNNNVSVVAISYDILPKSKPTKSHESAKILHPNCKIQPVRKISKMSTCESSGSTNNIDSDTRAIKNTQKRIITAMRHSPKTSARERMKKTTVVKKETDKRQRLNLDEWKKKLNAVYGLSGPKKAKGKTKMSPKKPNVVKRPSTLNNTEYIPYSHLTLGGVRVSDIEREISNLPNKTDLPLSPILDKILSSRENSFHEDSSKKDPTKRNHDTILTTSDEKLLREVIDIERSVEKTLSKSLKKKVNEPVKKSLNVSNESGNDVEENDSYPDDFEDEKSDQSEKFRDQIPSTDDESGDNSVKIKYRERGNNIDSDDNALYDEPKPGPSNIKNITYTKASNLSFKDSVDIFEFIHSVDTHDTATQSNGSNKITPKETQTSPRNDRPNIQPIHNDLWPSIDPRKEVEKMFELEKDFIKKLIVDEYGDLLEKNINKPSTSKENTRDETKKNVTALQKNTQTSPAHVKSVMTSPRKTKTRPTSPFLLSVPVHQQTSPMVVITNEDEQRIDIAVEADDISVNLSSPRFSLRLPQNSREVLSNLEEQTLSQCKINAEKNQLNNTIYTKTSASSSSSLDADNSSSEISSLGEVRFKKKLMKRVPSISEYSSSSTVSKNSYDMCSVGILPLRSEGELSVGQISKKKTQKQIKSDGETNFGYR